MSFINLGFKVGDLVVVKDTICWMTLTIVKGEICMITRIYGDDNPEIFRISNGNSGLDDKSKESLRDLRLRALQGNPSA